MSRSTNASEDTPDDEGRLADDSDTSATPEPEGSDDTVEDAPADEVEDAGDESQDEVDDEPEDTKAVAGARGRSAGAARSSAKGDGSTRPRQARPKASTRPVSPMGRTGTKTDERRGPIAAIVLFVRQVIAELRKVVTPTGKELGTYVAVVVVFVLIVMAYVGLLDLGIGKLILWAFGG